MFSLFKFKKLTTLDYIKECFKGLQTQNYNQGLKALGKLGQQPEIFRMKENDPQDIVYFNAYADMAAKYFAIDPEKTSTVLFSNIAQFGSDNPELIQCNSKASHKAQRKLIADLSDGLSYSSFPCSEAERENKAKHTELAFKNHAKLIHYNREASDIEMQKIYALAKTANEAGAYMQVIADIDQILMTFRPIREQLEAGKDSELTRPYAEAFHENILLAMKQAKDQKEEKIIYSVAFVHQEVLQHFKQGGYAITLEEMRQIHFEQKIHSVISKLANA